MQDEAPNKSETSAPRFLLIMPQGEEFNYLRALINSFLKNMGMIPVLWDEVVTPGSAIVDSMQKAIELADVVIVDVTGNNPNVLFEAGFALGAGKSVLPIVQRSAGRVPMDIAGRLYLVYDPSNPIELSDNIKTFVLRSSESGKA